MQADAHAARTILVVEDNAVSREGLKVILANAGYTIVLAENGQQALALLQKDPVPDLVLLDMLMPVLDGWHFLKQIQQVHRLAAVPVVVVTGTILTREWAQSQGCAGFVHKPIDPQLLLEEIRRCL